MSKLLRLKSIEELKSQYEWDEGNEHDDYLILNLKDSVCIAKEMYPFFGKIQVIDEEDDGLYVLYDEHGESWYFDKRWFVPVDFYIKEKEMIL